MPIWAVQLLVVILSAAALLYGLPLALGVTVGILSRLGRLQGLQRAVSSVLDPGGSPVPGDPAPVVGETAEEAEQAEEIPGAHAG